MKRAKSAICAIMMMFVISACAGRTSNDSAASMREQEEIPGEAEKTTLTASPENGSDEMPEQEEKEEEVVMDELILSIGDKKITVEWENNESVDALKDLAGSGMQINMSMYGGFEQVGSLGTSLPRNDSQMTTSPGDIVLYSGNQIVIFYG